MTTDRPQPFLGRLAEKVATPGRAVLIASSILFAAALGSLVVSAGTTVVVTTNTPGATVQLDGRAGSPVDDTTWLFQKVPFGKRYARALHRDFVAKGDEVRVGPMGKGRFHFDLERRKVQLTLNTSPGAEVFLNGQSFGKADPSGVFSNDQIPAGDYELVVRLRGYEDARWNAGLHEDSTSMRASLQMTQETRADIARQRERAFELIREAESLFNKRSFRPALNAVEESLRLNPDDYRAQQLRQRIVEIMQILQ